MVDVPNFQLAPTLRCGELLEKATRTYCGAPASHFRSTVSDFPLGYFCERHARRGDHRINGSFLFRRVNVQLEVLLSGVSFVPQDAEHEGVELVRRALERSGALVGLVSVTSAVGRYTPPAPARRGPKPRGGG